MRSQRGKRIKHMALLVLTIAAFCNLVTRQEEVREQERETEMRDTEMLLSDRIRKLETDNEHEERVTAEVESFLRDQHLELSSKMEAWTR